MNTIIKKKKCCLKIKTNNYLNVNSFDDDLLVSSDYGVLQSPWFSIDSDDYVVYYNVRFKIDFDEYRYVPQFPISKV